MLNNVVFLLLYFMFHQCGTAEEAVRERLFSPIFASPMSGIYASLRQAQIIILEILQCIPVVIIFTFLDLGKNISFSDSLRALSRERSKGL
jgi:hypothetical protein